MRQRPWPDVPPHHDPPRTARELLDSYADGEWLFRSAELATADLRGAVLSQGDFRGANLAGADLRGAVLVGADLREANLAGVDARATDFTGANLLGADCDGANLVGARLIRAAVARDTLAGAHLGGVILLCAAGRVERQIDLCGNPSTTFYEALFPSRRAAGFSDAGLWAYQSRFSRLR